MMISSEFPSFVGVDLSNFKMKLSTRNAFAAMAYTHTLQNTSNLIVVNASLFQMFHFVASMLLYSVVGWSSWLG